MTTPENLANISRLSYIHGSTSIERRKSMYGKFLALLGALSLAAIFSGCAHGPAAANAPLVAPEQLQYEELHTSERFRKYESIGIRPFSVEETALLSTDPGERTEMENFRDKAADQIAAAFVKEMKGGYYKGIGIVSSDEEAAEYDLVIEGQISEIDRGNRASRYMSGTGWTHISLIGTMTDTKSGDVVVKFRDTKYGKGGTFGGDSIDLLNNNCQELGANLHDFLRDVY